jgi:hypothetical protein
MSAMSPLSKSAEFPIKRHLALLVEHLLAVLGKPEF